LTGRAQALRPFTCLLYLSAIMDGPANGAAGGAQPSGLTSDELQRALRFLAGIAIKRCPPGFDLRGLLVACLRDECPQAASKIERMDDRQVQALCEEIMQRQQQGRRGHQPD
jgi:hypothetical protein